MRLRETNGDQWGLMRLRDHWRLMRLRETNGDHWGLMRLREITGDSLDSERLLESHETNGDS